ncbi:Sperm flagellar protein 1 [Lamellibrachia satsuma]|nr:Sperm flagellar protein 1 [Lamellibrachia satsuma]
MTAELIKHFLPTYIDMHNYSAASSTRLKEQNWLHLCRRVLRRLGVDLSADVIQAIAECKPWVIETVLVVLRHKINLRLSRTHAVWGDSDWMEGYDGKPSDDQQHYGRNPMFASNYSSSNAKYIPSAMESGQDSHRSNISKTKMPEVRPFDDNFVEMVPRMQLVNRQKKLVEKENQIQVLLAKVDRLESAIRLKDLLIGDLSVRVQQLTKYLGSSTFQQYSTRSQIEQPDLPSPRRVVRDRERVKWRRPIIFGDDEMYTRTDGCSVVVISHSSHGVEPPDKWLLLLQTREDTVCINYTIHNSAHRSSCISFGITYHQVAPLQCNTDSVRPQRGTDRVPQQRGTDRVPPQRGTDRVHRSVALTVCHRSVALTVCHHSVALTVCHHSVALTVCHRSVALTVCHHSVVLTLCHRSMA